MIKEFESKDLDEINALGQSLNPNFTELFHIDNLSNNEKIYVYKENNKVLGFIQIMINYEVVEIINLIVSENNRNHGIASLLMDYMITELPKTVERLLLEVNEQNKNAIRLYYKFNFQIINIRKKYYQNNNALIMERILK